MAADKEMVVVVPLVLLLAEGTVDIIFEWWFLPHSTISWIFLFFEVKDSELMGPFDIDVEGTIGEAEKIQTKESNDQINKT